MFLCALAISGASSAQNAKEIMRKVDQQMRGESSYGEMTMRIVRPEWTREVSMKSWSKDNEYALILITAPARDKGIAYLKRGTEIWNWQPSIDRVVKLPPSMMSQSWMGSDFTNDDLVRESSIVEDYTHEIIGDSTIMGRETHIIEMLPTEEAAVVWGKVITYVDKNDYLQLKSKFYDEEDELVNIMNALEIEKMDDRLVASRVEMIPADEPDRRTVIEYNTLDFNVPMETSFFSLQNMKNLRP